MAKAKSQSQVTITKVLPPPEPQDATYTITGLSLEDVQHLRDLIGATGGSQLGSVFNALANIVDGPVYTIAPNKHGVLMFKRGSY